MMKGFMVGMGCLYMASNKWSLRVTLARIKYYLQLRISVMVRGMNFELYMEVEEG